jgi:DNA-binding transcriptional regulator YiaG
MIYWLLCKAPVGPDLARERSMVSAGEPQSAVEVLRLRREEELGPAAIARRLGIGRASV